MPLPAESLTNQSEKQAVSTAISKSIETWMKEPIPEGYDVKLSNKQKWWAAKSYSMARKSTGKSLGG